MIILGRARGPSWLASSLLHHHTFSTGRATSPVSTARSFSISSSSISPSPPIPSPSPLEDPTSQILHKLTVKERQLFGLLTTVQREHFPDTVLRVAGGWVRDKLLGLDSDDIDIALDNVSGVEFATRVGKTLRSRENRSQKTKREKYAEYGMYVVKKNPEKSKHLETASLEVFDFDVDFVNLRSEHYDDPESRVPTREEYGEASVDASRRDLTMNALFFNLSDRKLEDWTECGVSDLRKRFLRTPPGRAPRDVLLEDPLRAIRTVRFAVKFGFQIEDELWNALSDQQVRVALQQKVSPERVVTELDKMFLASFTPSISKTEERTEDSIVATSGQHGGDTRRTKNILPENILSQLGMHEVVLGRPNHFWDEIVTREVALLRRHLVLNDVNDNGGGAPSNRIVLKNRPNSNVLDEIGDNAIPGGLTKEQTTDIVVSTYATIIRSLLRTDGLAVVTTADTTTADTTTAETAAETAIETAAETAAETTAASIGVESSSTSSSSSSSTGISSLMSFDLNMTTVHQCLQLRIFMREERKHLTRYVDEVLVRHLNSSKKRRDRVVHVVLGLKVLEILETTGWRRQEGWREGRRGATDGNDNDNERLMLSVPWTWAWLENMDLIASVDIVQCLALGMESSTGVGEESGSDSGGGSDVGHALSHTLKQMGGACTVLRDQTGSTGSVLTGHDIMRMFPICAGSAMSDATYAHKLWCGMRRYEVRQRKERGEDVSDMLCETETKREALEWMRDVYVPSLS